MQGVSLVDEFPSRKPFDAILGLEFAVPSPEIPPMAGVMPT
jgi:hypothetical protein